MSVSGGSEDRDVDRSVGGFEGWWAGHLHSDVLQGGHSDRGVDGCRYAQVVYIHEAGTD